MGTKFGPNPKSRNFDDSGPSPARFKEDFSPSATLPRNVKKPEALVPPEEDLDF